MTASHEPVGLPLRRSISRSSPHSSRPRSSRVGTARTIVVMVVLALAVALASGCSGEDATPIQDVTTTLPATPHQLEPSEQMTELARQQCLDDPELDEGVVNAVDPGRPDQTLASVTVDCAEVRSGSGDSDQPAGGTGS